MRLRYLAAIAALTLGSATAHAQPVNVDYVVTGSAGNWLYNFTVSNTSSGAPADLGVYLFGVDIGPTAVASSPSNWSQFVSWTTTAGTGTTYRNTWITDQSLGIGVGHSLSGFSAYSHALVAPTSVKWFAYAFSNTLAYSGEWYEGGDNFNGPTYSPGFESSATGQYPLVNIVSLEQREGEQPVTVTPEPSTYLLMASGLAALAFASRRKRNAIS